MDLRLVLSSILTTGAALSGCKGKPAASEAKFDREISRAVDISSLDAESTRRICSKRPIFIFIGNAEQASLPLSPRFVANKPDLDSIVNRAAESLQQALGRMPSVCSSAFSDVFNPTKHMALLVTITDGSRRMDSRIATTWYRFDLDLARSSNATVRVDLNNNPMSRGWVQDVTTEWMVDASGALVPNPARRAFELHLPTQVQAIVNHFIEAKPPGDPTFQFDQTVYLIKSHGGRFLRDQKPPTPQAVFAALTARPAAEDFDHGFLFDPNGPATAPMMAELYGASMSVPNACDRFAALDGQSLKADAELCRVCGAKVAGRGPFAVCSSPGRPAGNAQGALAVEAGNTMAVEAGNTMAVEAGNTLAVEAGNTLAVEAGNTLAVEAGNTLAVEAGNTLGGGKGLLFGSRPDTTVFDQAFQVPAGVQYAGRSSIPGLTRLALPLRGARVNAPFIVLDSCWGNSRISAEAFSFVSDAGADGSRPVVTALNPNPMGLASLNYGALDYFQYLAIPFVYLDAESGLPRSGTIQTRDAMTRHIRENGLQQALSLSDSEVSLRQIEIHVVREGVSHEAADSRR